MVASGDLVCSISVPAPRPKYELMTRISVAEDLRMRGYFDGEELQPIDYATIINGAGLRR